MSPRVSLRKRMFAIGGPALSVLLAYSVAFYGPLQRTLKAERTKLHKMEIVGARRSNPQPLAEKLAETEAAIQSLNEQLSDSKKTGSHLVSRRTNLRHEFLHSTSPALLMVETLALLNRHGLECTSSSPVADQDHSATFSESLKPIDMLLGGAASDETDSLDRREMRVTLRGRFQDIQSALCEIQAAPLGIFTVSLEMEDSDVHTDIRIWILTIAV